MLPGVIEDKIKNLIMEGYTREETEEKIAREHGKIQGLTIWYDCCYNTICKEQGINRKKGEELKVKRARANRKIGK